MGLNAKTGIFSANTTTGNQSITGLGFQPEAIIFFPVSTGSEGIADGLNMGFGFVAVASSGQGIAVKNQDNYSGATHQWHRRRVSLPISLMVNSGTDYNAILIEASLVSFDSDGFTINIASVDGAIHQIGYLALGGSALTNAKTGVFANANATGNQSITGVGFQPDVVLFFGVDEGSSGDKSGTHLDTFLGFAKASAQGVIALGSNGGTNPTDTHRYQSADKCLANYKSFTGSFYARASIVSLDNDGFTLNYSEARISGSGYTQYLALKGINVDIGTVTSQTSTGNFSKTGLSFTPSVLMLLSFLRASSSAVENEFKGSFGVGISSSNRLSMGGFDEDNVSTNNNATFIDSAKIYKNYNASKTLIGAIDLVSLNSDGFTLDQTTADSTGNEILYLALGTSPPTVTTDSVGNVNTNSAVGNGNVTSDGGDTITERGFVLATTSNPTTANTKFTSPGTTGAFSVNLTGLSPGVTYHVRAYAINGVGTSYGADLSFTTTVIPPVAPTISTQSATNIRKTKVQLNGRIDNNGGADITDSGFIISTDRNSLTIGVGTQIQAGPQSASFSKEVSDLSADTTYFYRAYATNFVATVYGNTQTFKTPTKTVKKSFYYKVYSSAGVFTQIWSKEVMNLPSFKEVLNQGHSELVIQLSRRFDDFGEGVDVALNNKVELWVVDDDAHEGLLMYTGYISGYSPIFHESEELIEIKVFPFEAEFQRMILRDEAGNTALTYTNKDPGFILKDIIDKYRRLGGNINYSSTSIADAHVLVNYTFNTNTIKECLEKIITMYPAGYYWRVSPDLTLYLQPQNSLADITFTLGLQLQKLTTFRRIEDVINTILFTGSGNPALFTQGSNTQSRDTYGVYERSFFDQRVSDSSLAGKIINHYLGIHNSPEIRSLIKVLDNNPPNQARGFNIESLHVGQTLRINNLKVGTKTYSLWDTGFWDTDVWDQTLSSAAADVIQILSLSYELDIVVLEATSRLPLVSQKAEEILRQIEESQTVNNPTSPT